MISFRSRNEHIRMADIITRKAHSQYPHISVSRNHYLINKSEVNRFFWKNMDMRDSLKLASHRMNIEMDEKNSYKHIINCLQNKLGNCSEESKLAELIAKINGQKNIYVGKIFAGKGFEKHEVAFITNKKIEPNKKYSFKSKEALVIDPWLGVTEYAGNYFKLIKTKFGDLLDIRGNSKPKIKADFSGKLSTKKINELKNKYPELMIKNYKKIVL